MTYPLWYPQMYCERYGQEWCAGAPSYDGPPHYPDVPIIRVRDIASAQLPLARANFWRKARDYAIDQWEQTGLIIRVREVDPWKGYKPGFITLAVTQTHDHTAGQAGFGMLPEYPVTPEPDVPAPGVAWAHVDAEWFDQQYASNVLRPLKRVTGHEIGHLWGFGHDTDNKSPEGLMTTFPEGDASSEEIAAVVNYFNL